MIRECLEAILWVALLFWLLYAGLWMTPGL
jgi:hypothetical protein